MKRVAIVLTIICLSLIVISCPFLPLDGLDNPADPEASSYQGFHLTDDPDKIVLNIPDNARIDEPILIFSKVIDAEKYKIEVSLEDTFSESKVIDSISNVVEVNLEKTHHTRYWRVKVYFDSEWWTWSKTGSFIYLHPNTVYFDSQGGSVSVPEYKAIEKGKRYGTLPVPTSVGKEFDGWFNEPDGEGDKIDSSTIVSTDQGHVLYAKWLDVYTVTYNGNGNTGGAVPANQQKVEGRSLKLKGNTGNLKRTGYYFDGWNTKPDGSGTNYFEEEIYREDQAITLYANWRKVYNVRELGPAGGYVFYDKGFFSDGWRYLEAAPAGWSGSVGDPKHKFGGRGVPIGEMGEEIGSGKSNTQKIVKSPIRGQYAAGIANNYVITVNGVKYDDWFLPSLNELMEMDQNLCQWGYGGISYDFYWSSSKSVHGDYYALLHSFKDSLTYYTDRDSERRIRPVRAF